MRRFDTPYGPLPPYLDISDSRPRSRDLLSGNIVEEHCLISSFDVNKIILKDLVDINRIAFFGRWFYNVSIQDVSNQCTMGSPHPRADKCIWQGYTYSLIEVISLSNIQQLSSKPGEGFVIMLLYR